MTVLQCNWLPKQNEGGHRTRSCLEHCFSCLISCESHWQRPWICQALNVCAHFSSFFLLWTRFVHVLVSAWFPLQPQHLVKLRSTTRGSKFSFIKCISFFLLYTIFMFLYKMSSCLAAMKAGVLWKAKWDWLRRTATNKCVHTRRCESQQPTLGGGKFTTDTNTLVSHSCFSATGTRARHTEKTPNGEQHRHTHPNKAPPPPNIHIANDKRNSSTWKRHAPGPTAPRIANWKHVLLSVFFFWGGSVKLWRGGENFSSKIQNRFLFKHWGTAEAAFNFFLLEVLSRPWRGKAWQKPDFGDLLTEGKTKTSIRKKETQNESHQQFQLTCCTQKAAWNIWDSAETARPRLWPSVLNLVVFRSERILMTNTSAKQSHGKQEPETEHKIDTAQMKQTHCFRQAYITNQFSTKQFLIKIYKSTSNLQTTAGL